MVRCPYNGCDQVHKTHLIMRETVPISAEYELTMDTQWHDLDISDKVDVNTVAVLIKYEVYDNTSESSFFACRRKVGEGECINHKAGTVGTQKDARQCWVGLTELKTFNYRGNMDYCGITILGWYNGIKIL